MSRSARRHGIPLTLRNPEGEPTDILISTRPGNAGEILTSGRRQLPPLASGAMQSDELRAANVDLDDRNAREGLTTELEKTTDTALTDIRAALASQKQARLDRHGTPTKLGLHPTSSMRSASSAAQSMKRMMQSSVPDLLAAGNTSDTDNLQGSINDLAQSGIFSSMLRRAHSAGDVAGEGDSKQADSLHHPVRNHRKGRTPKHSTTRRPPSWGASQGGTGVGKSGGDTPQAGAAHTSTLAAAVGDEFFASTPSQGEGASSHFLDTGAASSVSASASASASAFAAGDISGDSPLSRALRSPVQPKLGELSVSDQASASTAPTSPAFQRINPTQGGAKTARTSARSHSSHHRGRHGRRRKKRRTLKALRAHKGPWETRRLPLSCCRDEGRCCTCCASSRCCRRTWGCMDDALDVYAEGGARIKYFITDRVWFSVMIFVSITVAAASVGIGTYGSRLPDSVQPVLDVIDAVVLSLFTVEAAVKIWAEGRRPLRYFQEPWNVFDFSIVIASFLPIPSEYQSLVRLIRLLRVLKIVRALSGLRVLVVSLFKSVQSLAYIAGLLLLMIYMYGVLGFSMFHKNDPANFATLQSSMLTLFRITTGDDWVEVFRTNAQGCDQFGYGEQAFTGTLGGLNNDGFESTCTEPIAKPVQSVFFFVSYIFLTTFVLINVIVGVVVSSVAEASEEVGGGTRLTVTVVRCIDLPARDWLSGADPYVQLTLGGARYRTKHKTSTLNPWWVREVKEFGPLEEMKRADTLRIHVKDWNRIAKDQLLGHVTVPLDTVPFNREMEYDLELRGCERGRVVIKVTKQLSASLMDPDKLTPEDRMVHSVALAREHWNDIVEEMKMAMLKRRHARRKALKNNKTARRTVLNLSRAFMALHESYAIMLLRFHKVQLQLSKQREVAASELRREAVHAVAAGQGLEDSSDSGSDGDEEVTRIA